MSGKVEIDFGGVEKMGEYDQETRVVLVSG